MNKKIEIINEIKKLEIMDEVKIKPFKTKHKPNESRN